MSCCEKCRVFSIISYLLWLTAQWHSVESLCRVLIQTRKNNLFFFDCIWLNQLRITQVTRRCVPQTERAASKAFQKATFSSLECVICLWWLSLRRFESSATASNVPRTIWLLWLSSMCLWLPFPPQTQEHLGAKTALFSSNNYKLKTSSPSVILMFIYTFIVICS